jgi:hypothetical protein
VFVFWIWMWDEFVLWHILTASGQKISFEWNWSLPSRTNYRCWSTDRNIRCF